MTVALGRREAALPTALFSRSSLSALRSLKLKLCSFSPCFLEPLPLSSVGSYQPFLPLAPRGQLRDCPVRSGEQHQGELRSL